MHPLAAKRFQQPAQARQADQPRPGGQGTHTLSEQSFGTVPASGSAAISIADYTRSAHFTTHSLFLKALVSNESASDVQIQEGNDATVRAGERRRVPFGKGVRTITALNLGGEIADGNLLANVSISGCGCPP